MINLLKGDGNRGIQAKIHYVTLRTISNRNIKYNVEVNDIKSSM